MPLIDMLVGMGVLGALILGILSIRALRRKARPEILGRENASGVMAESQRRCRFCRKPTDPRVDIFMQKAWYHRTCFLNQADEGKAK